MAEFKRVFSVRVPVFDAWRAFTEPDHRRQWYPVEDDIFQLIPGGEVGYGAEPYRVQGRMEEVEEGRRLRWSEGPGQLPGTTEITVVFEEADTGSRITITHAGFGEGPDWIGQLDGHARGWTQIMADFALYAETGVPVRRAFSWPTRMGVVPYQTDAGVRLGVVIEGGAAADAGLRPEDLLVSLGTAPIFDITDLWSTLASHRPGQAVPVEYVRDGSLHTGEVLLAGS